MHQRYGFSHIVKIFYTGNIPSVFRLIILLLEYGLRQCLQRKPATVGFSMKCYKDGKESKACFGERQDRGRIGKELY